MTTATLMKRAEAIERDEEKIARERRIRARAERLEREANLERITRERTEREEAARRAEAKAREEWPFDVCVEVGSVRVDFTAGQVDGVQRQMGERGIAVAMARLGVWRNAAIARARVVAQGKNPVALAPASEVAAMIRYDLRHLVRDGFVTVEVVSA
jgi:hypothetical protein